MAGGVRCEGAKRSGAGQRKPKVRSEGGNGPPFLDEAEVFVFRSGALKPYLNPPQNPAQLSIFHSKMKRSKRMGKIDSLHFLSKIRRNVFQ